MIDIETQFPGLINAIIEVESDGKDSAIGDKGLKHPAYGPLQIRQPYVDDYNRMYKKTYKAIDCLGNRALSIQIFNGYMWGYCSPILLGHPRTAQDIARIHNGGPSGWKEEATLGYWAKVQKFYKP